MIHCIVLLLCQFCISIQLSIDALFRWKMSGLGVLQRMRNVEASTKSMAVTLQSESSSMSDNSVASTSIPPLMTPEEVAQELRCSRAHVYNILARRVQGLPVLPSIHIGRRTLVRRTSFHEWLLKVEHVAVEAA